MAVVYHVAIFSLSFVSFIPIPCDTQTIHLVRCLYRSFCLCIQISLIPAKQGSTAPAAAYGKQHINTYDLPSNEYLSYLPLLIIITDFLRVIEMPFAVKALDHVVLTCRNINATVKFYNLLGMKHEVFRSSKDAPGVERYVKHSSF